MLVQSSPIASAPLELGRPRKQHGKRALATLLREHGVLSVAHAADLALDVCDALAPAHENGVVHGQLGLRCVRLTLVRGAGPRDVDVFTLTADDDSEIAQKAAPFLAPEQRDLSRPIDGRADIWALGALLYTVIVGMAPPAGPVRIPADSMPSSLAAIVEACLAIDPGSRPDDVDDLSAKIASFATWPPDRFARLAERRERRMSAMRAKSALEARGLANMPDVLDKLDEAALTRAQRETMPKTATMASILERPTTTAALERLMAVVYEGTEAARVELAADLPALLDFDDEDEEVIPTAVHVDEPSELGAVFESPLVVSVPASETAPMFLPEPLPQQPMPSFLPPHELPQELRAPLLPTVLEEPSRRGVFPLVALVMVAFGLSLGVGYVGYMMTASPPPAVAAPPPPPAIVAAPAIAAPVAAPVAATAAAAVPVFSPSALPEVAPVTPGSLPDAKR